MEGNGTFHWLSGLEQVDSQSCNSRAVERDVAFAEENRRAKRVVVTTRDERAHWPLNNQRFGVSVSDQTLRQVSVRLAWERENQHPPTDALPPGRGGLPNPLVPR